MALNLSIRITADGKAAITEVNRVGQAVGKLGDEGTAGGRAAAEGISKVTGSAKAGEKAVAGLFAAFAVAGALKSILSVTAEFQKLNAQLVTVTGSQAAANVQFKQLQEFAASTPFQLNEVVGAFVKMKALGLDPSREALESFGNTASAMGKSLNQFIEAVADASASEFERLKEFGIKAKQEGDRVSLTFQGITTTIGNNAEEITRYLQDIGNNQFAGAMAREAATLGGAWSNLQDSAAQLANAIGTVLAPTVVSIARAMSEAAAETAGFIEYLGRLITFDATGLEETNAQIEITSQRVQDLQRHIALFESGSVEGELGPRARIARLKDLNEQLKVAQFAADEAVKAQEHLVDSLKGTGEEAGKTKPKVGELSNEFKKAAQVAAEYILSLTEQRELLGLSAAETLRYKAAQEAAKAPTKALADEILRQAELTAEAVEQYDEAKKALEAWKRSQEERTNTLITGGDAIRQLEDMLEQYSATLAGPAAQAELQHINNLREIAKIEAALLESGDLTAANIKRLAQLRAIESETHKRELDEIAYAADEAAQAYDRAWTRAIDDVAYAFGDWIADGLDDFSDFADRIKDIFKRMIADMIAQMVKSGLMRMVAGLFGGGSSAAFAGTGSGFNFTSLLGGGGGISQLLFGSGQASAFGSAFGTAVYGPGMATQWAPTALGSVGLAAAGLGGAYYGYQQSGNLAGAVGYGALGLGAAGAVGGIASGAGAIAGATGAFSSLGAAAAIPVIGWIAAIAALVDMVSGGKLFGTKYRPESLESSLNIGADGGFATAELTEVRQRSLFRGRKWRTRDIDAGEETEAAAVALFDNIAGVMADSARALEVEAPPVIDAAIRTVVEYDKKGREKSRKILVDVLGRTWEEATAELAATRITAEAIIQTVDSALGGIAEGIDASGAAEDAIAAAAVSGGQIGEEFGMLYRKSFDAGAKEGIEEGSDATEAIRGEASAIAERWRGDAEQLLAGAQFLLAAAVDIRRGTALLGEGSTLTQITELVEELAVSGEPLLATYQRLTISTRLLDQALEMSGVTLDKTREEIVRLAVDIVDAAGGLDRATALWSAYFDSFYTETERAQFQLAQAITNRDDLLTGLGLDSSISNEDFRTAFEEALPTLTPQQIVQWLEAGAAITAANAAQAAYNDTLGETAEVLSGVATGALREYIAELEAARAEYSSFVAELRRELETFSLSEFQIEMRDITEWGDEATATLNDLARQAGMAAASEQDLALVHEIVAARTAEAIARLRNSARSLVDQLYGNAADPLIDATNDFVGTALGGIADVGAATNQLYQSQLAGIQRIQDYLDAQLLGDLTSLTPAEQLAEAQSQFNAAIQAALGGDAGALAELPRLADILLRLGRSFDPSDFPELEAMVRAMLQQVAGLQITDPIESGNGGGLFGDVGGPTGGGLGQVVEGTAQQVSEDRAELIAQLFVMVRDLIDATGLSLSEVAQSIGLNVQDFIQDMGINLDNLTVETVGQLAALSSRLGIRLDELATSVGVDLGQLADTQSLLNDAVEQAIFGLPEEDARLLEPLFRRIEQATDEASANAAIAELEAAVNQIGGATAAALAPFFGGIAVPGDNDLNALLNSANTIADDQLQELVLIRQAVTGTGFGVPPTDPGPGGPGGGVPGLPGTPGSATGSSLFVPDESDAAVVAVLTRIEDRLQSLEATTANGSGETFKALAKRAQDAERARDMALAGRRS